MVMLVPYNYIQRTVCDRVLRPRFLLIKSSIYYTRDLRNKRPDHQLYISGPWINGRPFSYSTIILRIEIYINNYYLPFI